MDVLDKMFQPVKSGVEAAREWLGERAWMRGTNGNPAFTEAATYLYALHQDSKAIDDLNSGQGPKCEVAGFLELAKFMAEARRGLDGWETQQGIRAIQAASEGTMIHNAAARRSEDQ